MAVSFYNEVRIVPAYWAALAARRGPANPVDNLMSLATFKKSLKPGDSLSLRPHSQQTEYFKKLDDVSPAPAEIPAWLKVNRKKFEVSITSVPVRTDAEPDIKEQLIVEYYSR